MKQMLTISSQYTPNPSQYTDNGPTCRIVNHFYGAPHFKATTNYNVLV